MVVSISLADTFNVLPESSNRKLSNIGSVLLLFITPPIN
ncbi:hypothetical protein JCM19294_115 [Nonlabens tegetincola]|uniref:Uncharacterized protein n=1 Tax=Nonlabens tegetincola TaxID=323273 RepID=A0A090Q3C6_9FLAO|nr:hypothetical protein JCM19294_115 [Nonlabens tegetincola]